MNDAVKRDDPFYVEATSSIADNRTLVLKQGDMFAIFDRHGDAGVFARNHQGVFHDGTRHLSYLSLRLGDVRPLLLSSTIKKDNLFLAADLTNPDSYGECNLPQGSLHVFRAKFLWQGICYERIKVANFNREPLDVTLGVQFDADFIDVFELRGINRPRRGELLSADVKHDSTTLCYRGLDGIVRKTALHFFPAPDSLTGSEALFEERIPARGELNFYIAMGCFTGDNPPPRLPFDAAMHAASAELQAARADACHIATSEDQFNNWVDRSALDLQMMLTETEHGPYPYAGVPWYSTVFGRDGIIAALQYLWLDPAPARGVLRYLAAHQATAVDPARDAEPGKILHETRKGEMANLGEVPFQRYYGSVDSTPLFVMLAGAYYERTGDLELVRALWPQIEAAVAWIDRFGDADGDGFVEYERHSSNGLVNQGWKDSHDAVFDELGVLAEGSVALCEVQGYVYAAKLAAGTMAAALGKKALASKLTGEAEALKLHFDEAFWCEELGTYALALDGAKRPLRVCSSNAGHALYSGIALPERAARLARTLLHPASFSGWGIRTIASTARNYNPMSYHNGSVWPHDNAMIALGLARYGFKAEALAIMGGMFETSRYVDFSRLPELFCGFVRRSEEAPTLYPVACSPQAWAAGTVFMLLQACLGIDIVATPTPQVRFHAPALPEFLQEVRLERLWIGGSRVDFSIRRFREDVAVHVLERRGDTQIVVLK